MKVIMLLALGFVAIAHAADEWIPLFPDGAPLGAKPPVVKEEVWKRGEYADGGMRHVTVPAYKVMLPPAEKRTGAAVVIFPGGGYSALAMGHEGYDYAKWMVERGIVAVLVKYRVSNNDASKVHFPVPLVDARRAIRTTRAKAKEWGVDPDKIGVMGSSAGGHLTSMCATMAKEQIDPKPSDETDKLPHKVNFAILVYPVIGMDSPWGHGGSKRRLLGPEPSDERIKQVATHLRVDSNTPPCFLIHAADDKVVPLRNCTEFAARCAEAGVPVVSHVYAHGGHGFGLKGREDSVAWPDRLEDWLVFMKYAHRRQQP